MKKRIFCLLITAFITIKAVSQNISLKKGVVLDSIEINDTDGESFALFLPKSFNLDQKWPIVFVFDLKGNSKQSIQMFAAAAEKQNYIIASPNQLNDSLSISENVLITSRMMNFVLSTLPVDSQRMYAAGFTEGAKFASVLPVIIKNIKGVVSVGEPIGNTDVLDSKNSFHYIGLVGADDYNLIEMQLNEKMLNSLRFPNELFIFENGNAPTSLEYIEKSLVVFTLEAMAKGVVQKDEAFIAENYKATLALIESLIARNKLITANNLISESLSIYRSLVDTDALKARQKSLQKDKNYKALKRSESGYSFKEMLLREDYDYALYEDVLNYNFNNLGWWNYQMQELKKYSLSANSLEAQMGKRLTGFVNHLVDSNIRELGAEPTVDEEGISYLWMLKTITNPKEYASYINVISYAAKVEDYGTALFYLEELLKAGYQDKKALYEIEHSALLRITPEFNLLVEKYLKDARYEVIEQ